MKPSFRALTDITWTSHSPYSFCLRFNHCEKKRGVWSFRDSCADSYVSVLNVDVVFRDFQQLRFSSHLARWGRCTQITFSTPCVEADDVWLVLSRSRPSTHFLPCGHSDSRVKFIWYPWISATWKCKVSWFSPPSFDTLVSVVTLFHPCCPSVHLENPTHIHAISY